MTPEAREVIRQKLTCELRQDVQAEGGSIADAGIILMVAALDFHSAMLIADGQTPDKAKAHFLALAESAYDKAFAQQRAVFRRIWQ
jgi:hypothetical protein